MHDGGQLSGGSPTLGHPVRPLHRHRHRRGSWCAPPSTARRSAVPHPRRGLAATSVRASLIRVNRSFGGWCRVRPCAAGPLRRQTLGGRGRDRVCRAATVTPSRPRRPHLGRWHRLVSAGAVTTPSCPGGARGRAAGSAPRLLPGTDRPHRRRCWRRGGRCSPCSGDSWWQLLIAAFLAVDVHPDRLPRPRRRAPADLPAPARPATICWACCTATCGIGLSYGWWVDKHNRHHAHPNHVERDPTSAPVALVFTAAQARPGAAASGRWLARHQAVLFFPMLLLEGAQPARRQHPGACAHAPPTAPGAVEAVLLGAHVGGYLAVVFLVCRRARRSRSSPSSRACSASTWAARFAPNHKGMPMLGPATSSTSCAARCSPRATSAAAGWIDWPWAG